MAKLNNGTLENAQVVKAYELVSPLFFKIFIAILIILLGIVAGRIVQRLLMKIFDLIEFDKVVRKSVRIKSSLSKIISTFFSYVIYFVFVVMALNKLEITTALMNTILVILGVLIVLFLIFGLNDIVANLFGYMLVKFKYDINMNDYIKFVDKKISGNVIEITSTNIKLDPGTGEITYVPYIALLNNRFKIQKTKIDKKTKTNKKKS